MDTASSSQQQQQHQPEHTKTYHVYVCICMCAYKILWQASETYRYTQSRAKYKIKRNRHIDRRERCVLCCSCSLLDLGFFVSFVVVHETNTHLTMNTSTQASRHNVHRHTCMNDMQYFRSLCDGFCHVYVLRCVGMVPIALIAHALLVCMGVEIYRNNNSARFYGPTKCHIVFKQP